MEANNNFSAGQNTDLSKVFLNKDSYLQALNFRAVGDLGDSNGSLVNIKGNECGVKFPVSQDLIKLRPTNLGGTTDDIVTITINGQTTSSITITSSTTGLELYNLIKALPNCYQTTNATPVTATFAVAYNNDYVVISQQPVYTSCSPVSSVFPNTVVNRTVGSPRYTLMFINYNNEPQTGYNGGVGAYVLTHATPYIIGSTFIDNDIYLLVEDRDGSTIPENDSFTGVGNIWKLSIDDITRVSTLTLLYVNYLDFTAEHPVAPSAITGRYESAGIKRIYWTDFYNKVRTVNVVNPQLMALSPTSLSLQPNVDFTQAILNAIISGSLPAGCYQLSYRLTQTLGAVTNISELSNPVYLNNVSEGAAFELYESAGGTTSKGIRWKVTGLDTRFDNIEFIVSYRLTDSSVPVFTSLGITTIDNSGTMTVDFTDPNTATYTNITIEEFLLFNATFTHAKTVDTKDNRLFWGNVKALQKELADYDARAFRANDAGFIRLTHGGTNTAYATVAAAVAAQPESSADAINEYYDSNGDYSTHACYLKPDGSGKLGGIGLNISYEFGTKSIELDNDFSISTSDNYDISRASAPYRTNDTTSTVNEVLIYDYPQNGKFEALKQPERTGLFKGFQHEEIYRFGLQLFGKEGNPYFVKWIGDIKMPSYGDTNDNPDSVAVASGISDFRLSFQDTSSYHRQYGQVIYLKFTIDLTPIEDIIGGYEIVRVKREGTNRTIWGCGMINPLEARNGNDGDNTAILPASWNSRETSFTYLGGIPTPRVRVFYSPWPDQNTVETLNLDNDDSTSRPNFAKLKTFDSWDQDYGLRPNYAQGDKILIRSRLKSVNFRKTSDAGYRHFFGTKGNDSGGNPVPANNVRIDNGATGPFVTDSNNDAGAVEPFYLLKMLDETMYCTYQSFLTSSLKHDYKLDEGFYMPGNTDQDTSNGYHIHNRGEDAFTHTPYTTITNPEADPCGGKQTTFVRLNTALYTSTGPTGGEYLCVANGNPVRKLLALYYKPNPNLYGGAKFSDRANNEYISCSEYIPVSLHSNTTPFKCYGGDTFTGVYDAQKTFKKASGSNYEVYQYNGAGLFLGPATRQARFSTTFFFPCTSVNNVELRSDNHINKSLNSDGGFAEDDYSYLTFNNSENDIKKYFPKPLDFQNTNEWRARVYFSEIKFDNETTDSWSQYLTNNFHDCEGTYGGINALITLNDQIYYLQDRAVGMLLINPVATVDGGLGTPVQLGTGATIQKHNNIAIDIGTQHQWSVYRSQSQIMFLDVRHKKLYLFNGQSLDPISDKLGQRNYFIKRLHGLDLTHDNPVKDKGVLTTYDYYHNEFLVTINNLNNTVTNTTDENYTIAFNEQTGKFTGMYSFLPNIYINSNKYLFSNINRGSSTLRNSIYLHNYGQYANFYGTQYPSTLKVLVNDNPLYTKVFDNIMWISEAIKDNLEWSDDLNITPGAVTNPTYPDDVPYPKDTFTKVRCYDQYQNTDFVTLTQTSPGNNLRKTEQGFMLQIPRNKFNYDTNPINTYSLFDPARLTKSTFGERMRDKWLIVDLYYPNTTNNRFIIHNLKTTYRISDR